jgi:putative membrane protein
MQLQPGTRWIFLLLFLATAVAWTACGKEYSHEKINEVIPPPDDDTTNPGNDDDTIGGGGPDTTGGNNSGDPTSVDFNFIIAASYINHGEIIHGQMATTQGENQSVRDFGQALVTRFTEAQDELVAVGAAVQANVPSQTDSAHNGVTALFESLQGPNFDVAFVDYQLSELQRAIELYQQELNNGNSQPVKEYAEKYLPYLQEFLQTATDIRQNL